MSVKIHDRGADSVTDSRIARVIHYLQQRKRWVTSRELQDELDVPGDLTYYVLHTLYMLDMVELGGQIAGRGRPKLAAQWIGRRTSTALIRTYLVEGSGSSSKGAERTTELVAERDREHGAAGSRGLASEIRAPNGPSEISASNGASS